MSKGPGKKSIPARRLYLVICVILGWFVYRTTRNYREHGGWDFVDLISTTLGACFGMMIGILVFWFQDRLTGKQRR